MILMAIKTEKQELINTDKQKLQMVYGTTMIFKKKETINYTIITCRFLRNAHQWKVANFLILILLKI